MRKWRQGIQVFMSLVIKGKVGHGVKGGSFLKMLMEI